MQRILSKESIRKSLYTKSDHNLGSKADNHYRNQVDDYLCHWLFEDVLDIVFDGQYANLHHQYHNTQR